MAKPKKEKDLTDPKNNPWIPKLSLEEQVALRFVKPKVKVKNFSKKKCAAKCPVVQNLLIQLKMEEQAHRDDSHFLSVSAQKRLPKIGPETRGKRSNPAYRVYGMALAAEYLERKENGEKPGRILEKLKELADKGKLKYYKVRRCDSIDLIGYAIKKYENEVDLKFLKDPIARKAFRTIAVDLNRKLLRLFPLK
jgi:hypothetical protein